MTIFHLKLQGYRFANQFRNRVWDGKIRLYSYVHRSIICWIVSVSGRVNCNRKNVDIKENNEISTFTTHTAADIQALIDSYDISITPRDYQFETSKYVRKTRGDSYYHLLPLVNL